tara:strand:- start:27050 stop:27538 length:489 start_codon:yes stop_codon:yes gene_type:complete
MNDKLIIKEKYSKLWPIITSISLISAVIAFYFYWSVSDILIEGYLRLIAFILFSIGLLSLYKLNDGQIEIITILHDDIIEFQYKSRNRIIYTEEWPANDIASIKIDEMPNRSFYNDIIQGDRCLRFRRNNQSDWTYLNSINGRVVPLTNKNALELMHFLKKT